AELPVSMVMAGREGGSLQDVMHRIAEFTEHQEDLKAKVAGAMACPISLAVVGFIVLNVLVIFFVPRFEPIFKKLEEKGELPGLTVAIVGLSHLLQNYLVIVLAVAALFYWLFRPWARAAGGRPATGPVPLQVAGWAWPRCG